MLKNPEKSLTDLLGKNYTESVCRASAALGLGTEAELRRIAEERVAFYPEKFAGKSDGLVLRSGEKLVEGLAEKDSNSGAGTDAFAKAFHRNAAPLSGLGCVRIGEDGRIALIGKSEHYQASLGHNFPGFRLLENARKIGILNATHNNTRGFITRLLEQELVRIANGLKKGDSEGLKRVLASREPHVLNRVINLETGSIACEAAFKMALARFYRLQETFPAAKYSGKIPVFLVMADYRNGKAANYHGTSVTTQLMRGMWPELEAGLERAGLLKVVPCAINNFSDFEKKVGSFDSGKYKVALFTHELVLMNYGGIRLEDEYVRKTHALCASHDIPVFVDEIQSCMWSPELFLFREYGCHPDFVSVGKGFPAGQYPASKILTTAPMDNLNQFGALVTNGQEELASLANLITIVFAEANAENTRAMGNLWQSELRAAAEKFPELVREIEGQGLLSAIFFRTPESAVKFCGTMGERFGIDASAQTYKADCPPAALMKLPLLADETVIRRVSFCAIESLKLVSGKA